MTDPQLSFYAKIMGLSSIGHGLAFMLCPEKLDNYVTTPCGPSPFTVREKASLSFHGIASMIIGTSYLGASKGSNKLIQTKCKVGLAFILLDMAVIYNSKDIFGKATNKILGVMGVFAASHLYYGFIYKPKESNEYESIDEENQPLLSN